MIKIKKPCIRQGFNFLNSYEIIYFGHSLI